MGGASVGAWRAPRPAPLPEPQLHRFLRWLEPRLGRSFTTYDELWAWSVSDLEGFWGAIWDYFDVESRTPRGVALAEERLPGAVWFPGTEVNLARQALRHADAAHAAGHPALVFQDEALQAQGRLETLSWPELRQRVGALAASLDALGVRPGDRVAAWLPNRAEALVAFHACASVGAVWSLCSPDMGPVAVLDRFRQIEPVVFIATDGQRYGGTLHDRRAVREQLVAGLPTLRHVIEVNQPGVAGEGPPRAAGPARHAFDALAAGPHGHLDPRWLPFDHPLWIVYSSGTTGLPKPIVHGHGGVLLEQLKLGVLHNDVGPTVLTGERFHWYSATGWIMWNCQVCALLGGTTLAIYDGSPAFNPLDGTSDWSALWRFAGAAGVTFFGAGAAFHASNLKAGVRPQAIADLSALRAVGSTGSPLSPEASAWLREALPRPGGEPIWVNAISGGTDFAGAFIAGLPTLPLVDGEMQCRCLGAAVEAWSEPDAQGRGTPLLDEVGELVCTRPMPSMPLRLWGDTDGRRLRDSYFDLYPGIWRHGDWLRLVPHPESGATGAVIYGRSDATINRHGIRMGTAELYRAVEALPEVLDALVVDMEYLGRPSWMPLFVVLREGTALDEALVRRLKDVVKGALSARHVPDEVFAVSAIPRTLSGKKMELPVKKLLMGADPARVLNPDAMANADSVAWFVDFARQRMAAS
jgi:acetoacetyl-CoA synthetase